MDRVINFCENPGMRAVLGCLLGLALAMPTASVAQAAGRDDLEVREARNAWTATSPPGPSDRVIVRFKAGADRAERRQAREEVATQDFTSLGRRFQLLALEPGQPPDAAVESLKSNPDVAEAARDGYSVLHDTTPDDQFFPLLWGLDNQGTNVGGVASSTPGADIDALKAWTKTVGDPSVVVAVLDSGTRPEHPDLKNRMWSNVDETAGDGLDNDGNGYVDDTFGMDFAGEDIDVLPLQFDSDPMDDSIGAGHGTHVSGTIAAEVNNGLGVAGVTQRGSFMPIRVCGWSPSEQAVLCPFSAQIAGINYAGSNGARVANMSLGGFYGVSLVQDAFAANPNTLFVVSAGNEGVDTELPSRATYPCSWDPTKSTIPGAVDNVVCVAASDQNDAPAWFTNWGRDKVDLAAPGTQIASTYIDPRTVFTEDFYENFAFENWSTSGFTLTTDFWGKPGIIAQGAPPNTTSTAVTPAVSISGVNTCVAWTYRSPSLGGGATYTIEVLKDGQPIASDGRRWGFLPRYQVVPFTTEDGLHEYSVRYTYNNGADQGWNNFWVGDVRVDCPEPAGQEDGDSLGYLNGTSMAAPHVSGTAALLAAYEPAASTMQLKQALLSSVDPVAQFDPQTGSRPVASGGRLNADRALDAVDALVTPETSITSGPSETSPGTWAVGFSSDAKTPVGFQCRVDGAPFAACTSPMQLSGFGPGNHTFEVRAKDTHGNVDPTPATATWTVPATQVPPPDQQQQAQPTLLPPTKVTGVSVKRTARKAVIRWRSVPGATSYRVTVGKTTKTTTKPSFTVKKLKPKSKATVKIIAVNGAGSSPVVTVKVKRAK